MQVFTTDKNVYLKNELKNWGRTIAFTLLLYFGFKLFSSMTQERLLIGVAVILILKIGDTLTQYHVKEIRIDKQKSQLAFILNSLLSGQKIKVYDLRQTKSEIIINSTWTNIFNSRLTLKITLSQKDFFRISSRYGFSDTELTQIDNALKDSIKQMLTR